MPKFPTLAHIDFAYTAIPDYFLDHVAPTLKECELKVMLYVMRRTLGYRKLGDCISYEQFISGITTREGKKLDQGAGVSRRALVTALANLEEKKLLSRTSTGYKAASTITLNLASIAGQPLTQTDQTLLNGETSSRPARKSAKGQILHPTLSVEEAITIPASTYNVPTVAASEQVQNQPDTQQILPGKALKKGQNLHPTINTDSKQKRVRQKPTQAQAVEQVSDRQFSRSQSELISQKEHENQTFANSFQVEKTAIANLITTEVVGLGQVEATRLAELVVNNGRDFDYVKQLVSYVTTTPSIRVPAAVLTTLIKTNQERQLEEPSSKVVRFSSSQSRKPVKPFRDISSRTDSYFQPQSCEEVVTQQESSNSNTQVNSGLKQEELERVWQEACQQVIERWQFEPDLLASSCLSLTPLPGSENGQPAIGQSVELAILGLPAQDALLRIRLSQAIKEVLTKKGCYQYQLRW